MNPRSANRRLPSGRDPESACPLRHSLPLIVYSIARGFLCHSCSSVALPSDGKPPATEYRNVDGPVKTRAPPGRIRRRRAANCPVFGGLKLKLLESSAGVLSSLDDQRAARSAVRPGPPCDPVRRGAPTHTHSLFSPPHSNLLLGLGEEKEMNDVYHRLIAPRRGFIIY